tara:strand:+ start:126 stop:581 length:456 start_codon:yes stop_codon:yes gene_type:complete
MSAEAMAQGGSILGGVLGYKGNQAAAKQAKATAEFNAQMAEQEAVVLGRQKVDQEASMRQSSERLIATANVATAASGIQMSGSALQAAEDSYFNTEMDALKIQYAGDIEQAAKASEAALTRATGAARSSAYKMASYQSLLAGGTQAATIGT